MNSILKRKYGFKLQSYPRVTMLIQGFEVDVKNEAAIFEDDQHEEEEEMCGAEQRE